jgi:hypothetical protein
MEKQNRQLSDDENPQFLFSTTKNTLLSMIAKGEIDPVLLAKQELAKRGCDEDGRWIGFENGTQERNVDPID